MLPDADCGAGNKVQISAYQEVSDVKRQQIVLNPQDNIIMGPQISTLVFQEQSTLPLSDALSSVSQIFQKRLPEDFFLFLSTLFYHVYIERFRSFKQTMYTRNQALWNWF